jgi:hypothetical protein
MYDATTHTCPQTPEEVDADQRAKQRELDRAYPRQKRRVRLAAKSAPAKRAARRRQQKVSRRRNRS